MSQQFLSINRGQLDAQAGNVTVGTSAPTADIYLQILSTNAPSRKDVLLALDTFKQYILSSGVSGGLQGVDLPPL